MSLAVNIIATFFLILWPGFVMMSPMMIAGQGFSDDKTSVITAILFFSYPIFIFLLIKLIGFKFYGTEPLTWALAFLAVVLIIIQLYGLPRMLFNIYNDIPNQGYHITKQKVYKDGISLKQADPSTFKPIEGTLFYSKDDQHVYADHKIIKDAHAPSFRVVEGSNGLYYKDKKSAYTRWEPIKNSDGETFEWLGHNYAKDKNHVYFEKNILKNADPNTFKALGSYIGRDQHSVFVRYYKAKNIEDIESFELVHFEEEFFARDKHYVYAIFYNTTTPLEKFPEADLATFKPIGEYYAVDNEHVYHYSYYRGHVKLLEGVKPGNFKLEYDPKTGADASSGERLFRQGEIVAQPDEN